MREAPHSLSQREAEKHLKPRPRSTENSEGKADGNGVGFISILRGWEAAEIVGIAGRLNTHCEEQSLVGECR